MAGAKGTITPDTIKLFVMGLPCVLVGTWLGLENSSGKSTKRHFGRSYLRSCSSPEDCR